MEQVELMEQTEGTAGHRSVESLRRRGRSASFRRTTMNQPRRGRDAWIRRAPLMPALVFMIVVTQLPFVATLFISFMHWNSLLPAATGFAGLSNYVDVFTDPGLRQNVVTTIVLAAIVVVVSMGLGLVIALLVDQSFFGRGIVRTLFIIPFLIVPVAAALVWKHAILNPVYGLVNGILTWIWSLFGSQNPPQPDFLSGAPILAVSATLIWQWTPFMMLILLAGLQSIPKDMMEAAEVDGAGSWSIFKYMTLPHLRQYLELGGLLGSIYIVQNFDAVFTLTAGGLGTANLPYVVYRTFYLSNEYGLASALGVVVVAGTIVIALITLRVVLSLFREELR